MQEQAAIAHELFRDNKGSVHELLAHRPSHGLDALGGKVTVLLQLLQDALALLLAWNPSNDVCCLRYALGGVIHVQ